MSPPEPLARHTVFAPWRQAALEMWGDAGLATIAERLPEDARRETCDPVLLASEWLPERYVVDWHRAVWSGPVREREPELFKFLHVGMKLGFGRVRRLLLNLLVSPEQLVTRAAELWRHEHSHGELTSRVEGRGAVLRLRDHPYTASHLSRLIMAESLRHAASLARARNVTQTHGLEGDALRVVLHWS